MDKFWNRFMDKVRDYRSRKFNLIGRFLLGQGISANVMTAISLIFGILAIYYLFKEYWLFFIFALLHYLADGLDGVIARISGASALGKYFDYFTDRSVELLLLVKIWLYFGDYFVLIIIALFLIAQTVYVLSKFKYPILFTRGLLLVFLALNLPVVAYLITGVAGLYSLALQARNYLEKM